MPRLGQAPFNGSEHVSIKRLSFISAPEKWQAEWSRITVGPRAFAAFSQLGMYGLTSGPVVSTHVPEVRSGPVHSYPEASGMPEGGSIAGWALICSSLLPSIMEAGEGRGGEPPGPSLNCSRAREHGKPGACLLFFPLSLLPGEGQARQTAWWYLGLPLALASNFWYPSASTIRYLR